MKVMLIASDRGELAGFGDEYIKVISGVGPIQAAAAAMRSAIERRPDAVVSVGSAGAISSFLEVGKAYSFGSVVTPDQDLTSFHLALGATLGPKRETFSILSLADRSSSLTLASSGRFASEVTEQHRRLRADAADMEAYGAGIACSMLSIPFFAVKLITDRVGDGSGIGKVSFSLRAGRDAMAAAVESAINRL